MEPPQPPLPAASSLPFQAESGSHIAMWMSESGVGLSSAATRQNGGRRSGAALSPGGMKLFAFSVLASVIVDEGALSLLSPSHDCARDMGTSSAATRSAAANQCPALMARTIQR